MTIKSSRVFRIILKANITIVLLFLFIESISFSIRVLNEPIDFAAPEAVMISLTSIVLAILALFNLWKAEINSAINKLFKGEHNDNDN